ncbi:Anthranilate synthase, aminase component [Candidatus Rhodobacter oscarellae]|uniref:Anthranilate synthase component 1 n=1 Tax=Candidatus Rhodobacter oscarellae TaxID=1675527 RepID=A0A0J9E1B6_9RHOB|nr:anthranilate synthase component I [Candidatus Rhodobacter lobularis]KMW56676.1 Anthranilate synthase, aminase component [Candidatus Rhodobacter lobularis]
MNLTPGYDAFAAGYERGENQVVYARLAADLDTPVSLMLKLTAARKDSFVLESVTGGEVRGRYSIIGMKPDLIWDCRGEGSRLNRSARFDAEGFEALDGDPLTTLRALIEESRIDLPDDLPAASAGLFGYLGYDMIRLVEHLPDVNPDPLGLPDAVLMRPSVVAVLDGVKGEVTVVSPAWAASGLSARAAYAQAAERVMDAVRDLERGTAETARDLGDEAQIAEPVSNFTKPDYLAAIEKAKEYIRAGDIFQCVPSQRWAQPFALPPFALYRSLRRTNPSPFMFFFNFGGFQVIGASPEILVRVFDKEVTIRPIAGTRPRGATPEKDRALEEDLLGDEKECAEHLMLLDLGRNDVGRVAKIGTVRPTEEFIIERYSHVMHIVSNVVGELSDEHDALSALLAGLPAGTVSGAPKVRAMEIIDELEPEKRGVYGGGVGYFSSGGDMDVCIALRTAVVKDETLYIQAGGGVVYDSDPEAEFEETVNKSKAIRKAAEDAGRFVRDGNR